MGGSIWNPGGNPVSTANADNSYVSQRFVASGGQTLFTISNFVYQTGTGSLIISVNGLDKSISTDFTEVDNTHFSLVVPCALNDIVIVHGMIGTTGAPSAAVSAAAAAASLASIVALSLPSLPLAIASGGHGQATKTLGFNALSPVTAKGDLVVRDATNNIRLPVGLDGQSLFADSTQTPGLLYKYPKGVRVSRASNIKLLASDSGKYFDITGGSFAQTLDPVATLTDGWFAYVGNSGTGFPVITPDGAEKVTVYGVQQATWTLWPQEFGILFCNASVLYYYSLQKGRIVNTVSSGVANIQFASGLAYRKKLSLLIEGLVLSNATRLNIKLNTSTVAVVGVALISTAGVVSAPGNVVIEIPEAGTGLASATGNDRMFGDFSVTLGTISTIISGAVTLTNSTPAQVLNNLIAVWPTINETNITDITLVPTAGTIGAGTVTLIEV